MRCPGFFRFSLLILCAFLHDKAFKAHPFIYEEPSGAWIRPGKWLAAATKCSRGGQVFFIFPGQWRQAISGLSD